MKGTNRALLGLAIMLVTVCCSSQVPVVKNGNATQAGQKSRLDDVKTRWEEERKKLDSAKLNKDYPRKELEILVKMLREVPASQIEAELERIKKDPSDYQQMSLYDRYFLEAFFLIHRQDREALVHLISAKCPRFVATSPIELEVASLEFKDSFLILIDSYYKADNPAARGAVLNILRESLKDLSSKYADDSEFINQAQAWYLDNGSRMAVNPYYHPFMPVAEQRNLFVPKP